MLYIVIASIQAYEWPGYEASKLQAGWVGMTEPCTYYGVRLKIDPPLYTL